jgi:hypothetical protein
MLGINITLSLSASTLVIPIIYFLFFRETTLVNSNIFMPMQSSVVDPDTDLVPDLGF